MISVKLIAKTEPVHSEFGNNLSEFVAYVARVSNPSNQWNHETAKKLLEYLERNKHFSPFEMADVVIEINTTRDIARQILRHRSFVFQEFSQRYAEVNEEFFELSEARLQDKKNRQNSIEIDDGDLQSWWGEEQHNIAYAAYTAYKSALEKGIAKEVARKVLPEGLTMSRLYMKGSIRSWLHYLSVRLDPTTQKEHREVAKMIEPIIKEVLYGKEF